MRRSLIVITCMTAIGCNGTPVRRTTDPAVSRPAQALFDGTSLDGWTVQGGRADFTVEDGCIVGRPIPGERNSFLVAGGEHANFRLEVEFLIDPGFNSGIQFRSRVESVDDPAATRVVGYQAEIDPTPRGWTAGIYEEGLRGWLAPLHTQPDARSAFRRHDWNTLTIDARGSHIRTWINGVPAVDFHDDAASTGIIALQVHGVGRRTDAPTVRWRAIRLTPMPE